MASSTAASSMISGHDQGTDNVRGNRGLDRFCFFQRGERIQDGSALHDLRHFNGLSASAIALSSLPTITSV